MKKLSKEKMENLEGGKAFVDCILAVAGFAGAAAASSTGFGIAMGALSFIGGVRSAQSCGTDTFWLRAVDPNSKKLEGSRYIITR